MDATIIEPDINNFDVYMNTAYGSDNGTPTAGMTLQAVLLLFNNGTKIDRSGMFRVLHFIHRCNTSVMESKQTEDDLTDAIKRETQQLESLQAIIKSDELRLKAMRVEMEAKKDEAESDRMANVIEEETLRAMATKTETLRIARKSEAAAQTELNAKRAMKNILGFGVMSEFNKLIHKTVESMPTEVTMAGMHGDAEPAKLLESECDVTMQTMRGARSTGVNSFGLSLVTSAGMSRKMVRLRDELGLLTEEGNMLVKLHELAVLRVTPMNATRILRAVTSERSAYPVNSYILDEVDSVNMAIEANIAPLLWRDTFGKPYSGMVKQMYGAWLKGDMKELSAGSLYDLFVPSLIKQTLEVTIREEEPRDKRSDRKSNKGKLNESLQLPEPLTMDDSTFGDSED